MASECMECVEGRAVALGLCSHCLAGEPVEAVVGQIARLARELEEARERERAHRQWIEAIAVGVRVLAHESEPGPEGAVIVSARNLGELQHGVARALSTPQEAGE